MVWAKAIAHLRRREMNKKLEAAFNEQIKHELYSSYLYLAMAAHFEAKSLTGFAHWMKVQAKEENTHAMKMFEFLNDRGVRVVLQAIPQPPAEYGNPLSIFEKVLEHEKKVTALIDKLYAIAGEVKDNAAGVFLQWFITEQVEEEKNATYIIDTLTMIKPEAQPALIMLDRELAKRGE
jgi:ferritin